MGAFTHQISTWKAVYVGGMHRSHPPLLLTSLNMRRKEIGLEGVGWTEIQPFAVWYVLQISVLL